MDLVTDQAIARALQEGEGGHTFVDSPFYRHGGGFHGADARPDWTDEDYARAIHEEEMRHVAAAVPARDEFLAMQMEAEARAAERRRPRATPSHNDYLAMQYEAEIAAAERRRPRERSATPPVSPSGDEELARQLQAEAEAEMRQFERSRTPRSLSPDAALARELYEAERLELQRADERAAHRLSNGEDVPVAPYSPPEPSLERNRVGALSDMFARMHARHAELQRAHVPMPRPRRENSGGRGGRPPGPRGGAGRAHRRQAPSAAPEMPGELAALMEMMGAVPSHGHGHPLIHHLHHHRHRRGGRGDALDVDDMSYDELIQLGERIGSVQRGASNVDALPVEVVDRGTRASDDPELRSCSICMEDYKVGDSKRRLECTHAFHVECIDQWLKDNRVCPICRHEVV